MGGGAMLTRRQFLPAVAAVGAAITLPLPRFESYEVGKLPWAGMPRAEQDEFNAWLTSYGVDPNLTYRVDVHRGHMVVYQYHGQRTHLAAECGGRDDEACCLPGREVPL